MDAWVDLVPAGLLEEVLSRIGWTVTSPLAGPTRWASSNTYARTCFLA